MTARDKLAELTAVCIGAITLALYASAPFVACALCSLLGRLFNNYP